MMTSGAQIQSAAGTIEKDDRSIQGALAKCLKNVSVLDENSAYSTGVSSRTDAGVHSLSNYIKADLNVRKPEQKIYTFLLMKGINHKLSESNSDMRVLSIQRVPDSFNMHRLAKYRHYVYRLAVNRSYDPREMQLPIHEIDRLFRIKPPFDMDKFLQAAEVLSGTNDFKAFVTPSYFERKGNLGVPERSIKTVTIGVKRGCMAFHEFNDTGDMFEVLEVHVRSKGFMYKQVRKTVSAMIGVANGSIPIDEIKKALNNPEKLSLTTWNNKWGAAPPFGLYLTEVKYNPEDLVYDGDENEHDEDTNLDIIFTKFRDKIQHLCDEDASDDNVPLEADVLINTGKHSNDNDTDGTDNHPVLYSEDIHNSTVHSASSSYRKNNLKLDIPNSIVYSESENCESRTNHDDEISDESCSNIETEDLDYQDIHQDIKR